MSTLVLALVCCGLYPLVVFGIAQTALHAKANGSLITGPDGTLRGSRLLAQGFSSDKYFLPRPSAAGAGYDAAGSSGSNLGPTSKRLADGVRQNVSDYRKRNGLDDGTPVPADAVTNSGSGLDPHISVRNAELQAPRVARARNMSVEHVLQLISANTDRRGLGALGAPGVNVLTLNLALDQPR